MEAKKKICPHKKTLLKEEIRGQEIWVGTKARALAFPTKQSIRDYKQKTTVSKVNLHMNSNLLSIAYTLTNFPALVEAQSPEIL